VGDTQDHITFWGPTRRKPHRMPAPARRARALECIGAPIWVGKTSSAFIGGRTLRFTAALHETTQRWIATQTHTGGTQDSSFTTILLTTQEVGSLLFRWGHSPSTYMRLGLNATSPTTGALTLSPTNPTRPKSGEERQRLMTHPALLGELPTRIQPVADPVPKLGEWREHLLNALGQSLPGAKPKAQKW